jgi:hypothetical protein
VGAVEGAAGRRVGWERADEYRQPPGGETAPVEVGQIDGVVAEQIGLDRGAMGG